MVCWQAAGAYQLLSRYCLFKLNSEAFIKSSATQSFSGDSWKALTSEFLLCSKTDALAEDLLSPAHTLLRSLKAAAVVANAFTPVVVPIPTSAAAVTSTEVDAVVAGAAAAVVAAANPTAAAEISAADSFSATVVAAAGIFSPAAAVQAAVAAEIAVLLEDEEQFLLSIQASLLLLARSLLLLLGGRFSCPACESF